MPPSVLDRGFHGSSWLGSFPVSRRGCPRERRLVWIPRDAEERGLGKGDGRESVRAALLRVTVAVSGRGRWWGCAKSMEWLNMSVNER